MPLRKKATKPTQAQTIARARVVWREYESGELKNRSFPQARKDLQSCVNVYKARYEKNGSELSRKALASWEERRAIVDAWTKETRTEEYFDKREVNEEAVEAYGFDKKHMLDVIYSLRQGNSHPIFTLLNSEKAKHNPAVVVISKLDEETSLCIYKHAKNALEKD